MSRTMKLLVGVCLIGIAAAIVWVLFIPTQADVLFVNGKIYTLNDGNTVAEAIAVKGDRIAAVGSTSSIERKFKAPQTIDLRGQTVLPGLIDAHAHLLSLGIARLTVDLVGAASEQEAAGRVKTRIEHSKAGQWIRGRGWDQNLWKSRKFPSHEALDRISPSNPVLLSRVDGHACWVNAAVLKISGVTRRTPDPSGGKIVRDSHGNPTGVFVDGAMGLVFQYLPPASEQEMTEAMTVAVQECLKCGLTTIHDMGVDSAGIELYKKLIDDNRFPIRVYAAVGGVGEGWEYIRHQGPLIGYGNNRLTVRALKMYIDGALGSRGAALIEPYSDDPGNRGLTVTSEENLRKAVDEALAGGFQVCTHAIGDRGNNIVLNVYQAALKEHPVHDHRLRIEHAQVLELDDIPRFKELGVIPSMQPTHCTSDMYWAEARLGPKRIRGAYAWRSLLKTGVIIAGGSDFPVEDPNPLPGIYAAMTRQDRQGRPQNIEDVRKFFQRSGEELNDPAAFEGGWYASERMTRDEAVRSFTRWAAFAAFEESLKGSLEKGKLADLVVLSKDIMQIPAKEILETVVNRTVVGGKIAYQRELLAPGPR